MKVKLRVAVNVNSDNIYKLEQEKKRATKRKKAFGKIASFFLFRRIMSGNGKNMKKRKGERERPWSGITRLTIHSERGVNG